MTNAKPIAPSDAADKYMLRFHTDGMRKQIKARAALNERTLNAEILFLIKRGLETEQSRTKPAIVDSVATN